MGFLPKLRQTNRGGSREAPLDLLSHCRSDRHGEISASHPASELTAHLKASCCARQDGLRPLVEVGKAPHNLCEKMERRRGLHSRDRVAGAPTRRESLAPLGGNGDKSNLLASDSGVHRIIAAVKIGCGYLCPPDNAPLMIRCVGLFRQNRGYPCEPPHPTCPDTGHLDCPLNRCQAD
jgi:hypothetical protein